MKRIFLICSCFCSIALFAKADNFSSSVSANIKQFNYKRPISILENNGNAGKAALGTFKVYWNNVAIDIGNSKKIFNTNLFNRNSFYGLMGDFGKVGIILSKDNFLNKIKSVVLKETDLTLNEKRFELLTKSFYAEMGASIVRINHSHLHCQKPLNHQGMTIDDLIAGCLHNSWMNALGDKKSFGDISFRENGLSFDIKYLIKNIRIDEKNIKIKAPEFVIKNPSEFVSSWTDLNLTCNKDKEIDPANLKDVFKFCINNLEITSSRMLYENIKTQTTFDFWTQYLYVINEKIQLSLPKLIIKSKKNNTTLRGINLQCAYDGGLFNVKKDGLIKGCLDSSKIKISEFESIKGSSNFELDQLKIELEKEIEKNVQTLESFKRPFVDRIKNLELLIDKGYFSLKTKVKFIFIFDFNVWGKMAIINERDELEISISKVKLPLGISGKKLLFYLLKKYVVSDSIRISNNKIYIDLK